jgi:hypothetical protein
MIRSLPVRNRGLPVPKTKDKASGVLLRSCKVERGFSVVLHEVTKCPRVLWRTHF